MTSTGVIATPEPVLPVYRQAIYNPGRLTDAEVKATFIARENLLREIADDIRGSRPGGRPQHHLIIGQRGMGKTTLLRRLDVLLREDSTLTTFAPLSFPEEQWTIDRLSKFWLNCLDSLADTLDREGRSRATISELDSAVDRLRRDPTKEDLLAEEAETEFLRQAKEIGRRPVLLVDNLDMVFSRLSHHEQKRLRSSLMAAGAPILIGACLSPPITTTDYSAPFYDHFKTHYLERLSLDEMQEILQNLAKRASPPVVFRRIGEQQPRLAALHTLTGGNPRTTAILFQILCNSPSGEACQDLETLLDWMTPLYRSRFEAMAQQAQLIVSTLATHWAPMSANQVEKAARLGNQQVSPQLIRLRNAGIVEKVPVDPEDRVGPMVKTNATGLKGYQLAERLFNLWILLRQGTHRDRRNLIFLARFIECVHGSTERGSLAAMLRDQTGRSAEAATILRALQTSEKAGLRAEDIFQLAIFDAYEHRWERAQEQLKLALDLIVNASAFSADTFSGWMRATAVLIHLAYGDRLVALIRGQGYDRLLRPWYEALRCQLRGDRGYLRNIPEEMRGVAGRIYDHIQVLLRVLPDSTRRWSSPGNSAVHFPDRERTYPTDSGAKPARRIVGET